MRWYWYEADRFGSIVDRLILDRYLGSRVTSKEHSVMMERLSIFKVWFLHQYGLDGSSDNIFAIHIDKIRPKYRDQYSGNDNPDVPGLRPTYLAPILGAPELAVPSKGPLLSPVLINFGIRMKSDIRRPRYVENNIFFCSMLILVLSRSNAV